MSFIIIGDIWETVRDNDKMDFAIKIWIIRFFISLCKWWTYLYHIYVETLWFEEFKFISY